jgi:hypothetical protein
MAAPAQLALDAIPVGQRRREPGDIDPGAHAKNR